MNGPPSPYMYKDPNARLLASVVPPPPAPLRTRIWRRIEGFRSVDVRRALAGLLEFEAWHLWIVAAAASAGLLVGVYRTELSSAARALGDKVPNVQLRGLRALEPTARNATASLRELKVASPERTRGSGERSEDAALPTHRSSTESAAQQKGAAEPGASHPGAASPSAATENAALALRDAPDKPAVRRPTSRAAKHRAMLQKKRAAKARAQKRIAKAKASRRGKAKMASRSSGGSTRGTSRRAVASRARAIAFGRE
jgi:hypothetical protein